MLEQKKRLHRGRSLCNLFFCSGICSVVKKNTYKLAATFRNLELISSELEILSLAAIAVACLHTVTGPDHYLPFIALSKARGWSFSKTLWWTILCGCGHVWSSVLLGLGGAAIGWSLSKIKWLETVRGGLAGWALLVFGLAYSIWGFIKARPHKHFDIYDDGKIYVYEHKHGELVLPSERHTVTPWVSSLFFC